MNDFPALDINVRVARWQGDLRFELLVFHGNPSVVVNNYGPKKTPTLTNEFMIGRRHCLVGLTAVGEAHPRIIALAYSYAMFVPAVPQRENAWFAQKKCTAIARCIILVGRF
ncbi:hypothetical protein GJ697_11635 [Pseudoduganella sp. FT25W]|uniref:Uncharacterized protein n=1 Tax=Duganella alba TaxID=2666081 RepID=A0A6L5QFP4_9BURK|nr:hypothetical protein [Duganella alba]MRX08489.1 hypothetical protein [Duganella alba]MRX17037.1 hypothetical protein [Duganella alba]